MSAQQLAPVAGVDIEAEWKAEQRATGRVPLDPQADPFGTQLPLGTGITAHAAHAVSRTAQGTNLKVVPPASEVESPASTGGGLRIDGVGKRYGTRSVLSDFSLAIPRGGFAAIVGRSGCGKSTLLRLIAGLETPDAGRIALDGHTLSGASGAVSTRIMFQDARLLPWRTVLENVALGLPKSSHAKALEVLGEVGLAERANDWPSQLSGGQRQRVALARALVHQPDLLLLDEPLGALDALTRIEMHALIERLWRAHGFTALLVTHDVQEAVALADRVVLIEQGQLGLDQPVSLARPRARGSVEFAGLEAQVLARVLQTEPSASVHVPAPEPLWPAATVRWAV
ncbi:ATP-binding cassette domain-containing protein [Pandoraea apista]|uniref:ATP-binding cassette domain-containing protein n=1 Tax=Pandoraea apista TaxID=93218 RepID=A0ABX9ZWC3_9BURK|nr:ATP-binding cassette domain-containing protein [Pandoraea apista]PTE02988.1 aliphatic sulfonate ABC transporter ATP-binding protein [Pandoraea apista]RRJ35142.1 ATP-binding cassette domain-containing protein [Pandoraea apista]RRJ81617.1 ATP-binding cassette domain-containing protein [Pandoraea apista]RSD18916.1 ATP-binding cassette domain-containing protein [Pandoraea apista]RSD23394.1 ATP-binding cassette domain-containing protein [Pandoraea apista]